MDEIESLLAGARAASPSPPPPAPPVVRAASLVEEAVVDITESPSQPRHPPDAAPESLDDLIASVGVGEGGGERGSPVSPPALAAEPVELREGGGGDEVDDLIHELGVGSSPEPSSPRAPSPPRQRPPLAQPIAQPQPPDLSKLTDAEVDLDLEIEALDL